ncbi:MAG: hypothetical protein VKM97_03915, partial [Cyanobacteriota bacterium]|nr:hypothetical protein [Cyanobacteriota bacterium]
MALTASQLTVANTLIQAGRDQARALLSASALESGALARFGSYLFAGGTAPAALSAAVADLANGSVSTPEIELVDAATLGTRAGAWASSGNRLQINGDWLMGLPEAERAWRLQWVLLTAIGSGLEIRARRATTAVASSSLAGMRLADGLLGLPASLRAAAAPMGTVTLRIGRSRISALSIDAALVPPMPAAAAALPDSGPTLSTTASNATFTEAAGVGSQAAAVAAFSNASVGLGGASEAGQTITGLGLRVSGLRDGAHEVVVVDGTTIALGAAASGSTSANGLAYTVALSSASDGSAVASLSFSTTSGLSAAAAAALINAITYQNTSTDNPSAGARSLTITSLSDSGSTANGGSNSTAPNISSTINVVAVNDGPLLGSLSAISLTDTTAQDAFTATAGTLSASDPEGQALSYGLAGASAVSASFEGVSYDLSKAGAYGTLYLNSISGAYRFQPKSDWQLNALSASGSESFSLSVSDGSSSTSQALLVTFSGSVEAPEQYVLIDDGAPVLSAEAQALWEQSLTAASRTLAELLSRSDRDAILNDVFGNAGTDAAVFEANRQALLAAIGGNGLRIEVDLRSDAELNGALAAYAAVGHTGTERIYVNGDKLNNGQLDLTLTTSALLEEFGSAIDQRLNNGNDSPGDEGQAFASLVT